MATVSIEVPPEAAESLRGLSGPERAKVIAAGLTRLERARKAEYEEISDILEVLARLPDPEDVLALKPSEHLQNRISELLRKNKTTGLSADEEREWEVYDYLEYLVQLAKARALVQIKGR